jgi:hypothetical protein
MGFQQNSVNKGQNRRNIIGRGSHRGDVFRFFCSTAFLFEAAVLLTGCASPGGGGESASASTERVRVNLPPLSNVNTAADFFTTAEKTASVIPKPVDKVIVLTEIAQSRQKVGDNEMARKTLTEAIQLAASLSKNDTVTTQAVFPRIAAAQASLGDMEAARKTAQSIPDEVGQSGAWSRIVVGQAEEGDVAHAIQTVGKAKFTLAAHQYAALAAIATEAVLKGDQQGARIVARNVEPHWQPKVYADVAQTLHGRGKDAAAQQMIGMAVKAVDGIHDRKNPSYENANRAEALITIAQVQLGWNDKAGAKKTLQRAYQMAGKIGVDSSGSWFLRNEVIGHLVTGMLQAGDLKTAQAAASTIKDSTLREAYLTSVKSGKPIVTPATEITSGAPVDPPAVAQARQGDVTGAKKTLEDIQDPAQRAMLLARVGEALQQSKERH